MYMNLFPVFFYDFSMIFIMLILAYLSKRLGDALKIPPFYRLLLITALVIFSAGALDIIGLTTRWQVDQTITFACRCVATVVAFFVCLRYWSWIFTEFLHK